MSEKEINESKEILNEVKKNKSAVRKILEKHFQDKIVTNTKDFKNLQQPGGGASSSYIAERVTDNAIHIIKHAKISQGNTGEIQEKTDAIREFIISPIYKRYLYDRTSTVELLNDEQSQQDKDVFFIRSKFLDSYQTLNEWEGQNIVKTKPTVIITGEPAEETDVHDNSILAEKIQEVTGFEKVLAASLFNGEGDLNKNNIGIINNAELERSFAKIDHGRSFERFERNENGVREKILVDRELYKYPYISPDARKLNEHIEQMLQVSDEEIENIVANRIDVLEKLQIDPKGIALNESHPSQQSTSIKENLNELKKECISDLKSQKNVMREFAKTLKAVNLMQPVSEQWLKGQWLDDIKGEDPILFAKNNGMTIDGKDPIQYGIENHMMDASIKYAIEKGSNIDNLHPILYAHNNNIQIDGKEPLKYAEDKEESKSSQNMWIAIRKTMLRTSLLLIKLT